MAALHRPRAVLFALPTFPRGILSLALPTVAASLRGAIDVRIVDLTFVPEAAHHRFLRDIGRMDLCGLSVSAQNLPLAIAFTKTIREIRPDARVIWGGELPTLLPDTCLQYADAVVRGRFEPHAAAIVADLAKGKVEGVLDVAPYADVEDRILPALDLVEHRERYLRFPGVPLETSLGCDQGCSFCLVHTVQDRPETFDLEAIERDLRANPRRFVNVVDYNLGVDREHLLALAEVIERSDTLGWTGEMCLAALDDDDVLEALARSRCRVIYCGLESVDEDALLSVSKLQNQTDEYRRIIRKVQSHGIEIASGLILGLPGTSAESHRAYLDFAEEVGLIYVKLTFLTFNPGTRAHDAMRRKGRYLTDDLQRFDGHHLTYLPDGVCPDEVIKGARAVIRRLYSPRSAWIRSRHLATQPARRAAFTLHSYCFGYAYRDLLRVGQPGSDGVNMSDLLRRPAGLDVSLRLADRALDLMRRAGH